MRRVLIIGSGGAGKSTLARALAERTGLPLVHLDVLFWRPGWVESDKEEWARAVARLVEGEAWVMDGNYGGTLEARLAGCDTVVFLDLPRLVCLARVLLRRLRYRGVSRPDVAAGCPERVRWEFLRWIWTFPRKRRPGILARLAALPGDKTVHHLRSACEVAAFLRSSKGR